MRHVLYMVIIAVNGEMDKYPIIDTRHQYTVHFFFLHRQLCVWVVRFSNRL